MAKMFAEERRNRILDYLKKEQRATVKELSEILQVSEATLRMDLSSMEQEGLLQRTHGGAVLQNENQSEYSFPAREKQNREEKILIGKKAAELVEDGQCILLDASSTALELARLLKKSSLRLTVVTNGIYTAMELKENPGITVILIGGVLRVGSIALEGSLGKSILNHIHVDTMFTSANGFTLENGLTDFNVYEVELKKIMAETSSRIVALLDHSKIGRNSIASFASASQVNTVITDKKADKGILQQLRQLDIQVIIA